MKNLLLLLVVLLYPAYLTAQDISAESRAGLDLVKPGVRNDAPSKGLEFIYGIRPGFDLGDAASDAGGQAISRFENWTIKLKAPIVYKPKDFKFILGVAYNYEKYFLEDGIVPASDFYATLDGDALKSTRLTAYLAKLFDSKIYAVARLEAAYNGNYDGIVKVDPRYQILRAALIMGYKPNDDEEFGVGGFVNSTFRRTTVWPFLMYNRTFNDKWGFESVIPVRLLARYNHKEGSLFYGGLEYVSREHSVDLLNNFGIDEPRLENLFFRRQSIQINVEWQRLLTGWIWLKAKFGYNYNLDSQIFRPDEVALDPRARYGLPATNGVVGRIGLFLSPSKKMMEKTGN